MCLVRRAWRSASQVGNDDECSGLAIFPGRERRRRGRSLGRLELLAALIAANPRRMVRQREINASDRVTVELVEADETPAVVIIRWPVKPTILHPRRFADARLLSSGCSPRRTRRWRR